MKNLLLLTNYYPFGNRETSFLCEEVAALSERFCVTVATLHEPCQDAATPLPDGVTAVPLKSGRHALACIRAILQPDLWREVRDILRAGAPKLALPRIRFALGQYTSAYRFTAAIRRQILPSFRPDVLYSFWGSSLGYETVLLKRLLPGAKAAVKLHRLELYAEQHACAWQSFRRPYARDVDALLFISDEGRRHYLQNWPYTPAEKTSVCYLGTRGVPAVHARADGPLCIVSCAHVSPVKRIDRIADALSHLDSEQIEWRHIGAGSLFAEVTAHAKEMLGGKANITYRFEGQLTNCDVVPLYRAIGAQLFLSVSESEGLPVSMMEAACAGVPILATDVGGVSEIVLDGETGFLMPKDAPPAEIAAYIRRFYALPAQERADMGACARRLWETRFDSGKNAAALAERLDSLS